jgi:hypothetical protein
MNMAQYTGKFLLDAAVHIAPEIMQFMLHPSLHSRLVGIHPDHPCCTVTPGDPVAVDDRPHLDTSEPVLVCVPVEAAASVTFVAPARPLAWMYHATSDHEVGVIARVVSTAHLGDSTSTTVEWLEGKRSDGIPGPLKVLYRFREAQFRIDSGGVLQCILHDPHRGMWVKLHGTRSYFYYEGVVGHPLAPACDSDKWKSLVSGSWVTE